MRIDRFLSDAGADSRSDIKKAARKGLLTVDGVPVTDPGTEVLPGSVIKYKGALIPFETKVFWMVHKPAGVLTATEDKKRRTVLDLLPQPVRKDLFPVGRLDIDTEGLILITNDGQLSHRLLAPKSHIDKTYSALLSLPAPADAEERFARGIVIGEDITCLPAALSFPEEADRTKALVTIREGKFHQVKKMFAALGTEVVFLKRLSIGPLRLDESLPKGGARRLTDAEVSALYGAAGLDAAPDP